MRSLVSIHLATSAMDRLHRPTFAAVSFPRFLFMSNDNGCPCPRPIPSSGSYSL